MKVFVIFCAVLLHTQSVFSQGYFEPDVFPGENDFDLGMSNFGSYVTKQVQDQVKSITAQINNHVMDINKDIQKQMQNLGMRLTSNMNVISTKMERQMENLGKHIQDQVKKSLEPLNAVMIRSAMAIGIGGTTVATYGDRITLMIINGKKYSCSDEVVESDTEKVQCTGKLTATPSNEENVCTESSYSRVNNIFCFGNYASFNCINKSCQCTGGKMYTLDTLKTMCGETYGSNEYVKYEYYPDSSDPKRIPLPHPNKNVKCDEGSSAKKCIWFGDGFILANKDI